MVGAILVMIIEQSLESMSVIQLRIWLESKGIPEDFCKTFEGKPKLFCFFAREGSYLLCMVVIKHGPGTC